jgi:chromosome segregation ATPase
MTTIDELEKLVNDYEQRINELKRLESVFNGLNTKGFEEEALSIKRQLKDPKAVKQVKKELEELRNRIQLDSRKTVTSTSPTSAESSEVNNRLDSLKLKNKDILVADIEKKLSNGETAEAERLLTKREQKFETFSKLSDELDSVKLKIRKLTDRVADGELDSEAYKRALDDFEAQKKEVEERLWKLRNELFKDDYEKPF